MKLGLKHKNNLKICPICKNKSAPYIRNKSFNIYRCLVCGFGFTDGLKAQSGDYHRDSTYIEEENLFRNIFQKRVNKILKFIKKGDILEVGCSTGIMLSLFKDKGFNVTGIEISKEAAKKAEERGVSVITKPFLKTAFDKKFDLVIFNHTLEHLENPILVLKKAKGLLKPKGILYIDLPNFDSLSLKFKRSKWPLLLPEEHLWHFTQKSFQVIFKNLDFKIVYLEKASGIWDFQSPIAELKNALIGRKKRFFSELFTAIPTLFITKLKKGSGLTIIARKK